VICASADIGFNREKEASPICCATLHHYSAALFEDMERIVENMVDTKGSSRPATVVACSKHCIDEPETKEFARRWIKRVTMWSYGRSYITFEFTEKIFALFDLRGY
jgi:gamma-glutamylcysteine synthetase